MKSLALIALLSPALALASDCEHSQDRQLTLDLDGVTTVRFEINSHELRLSPANGADSSLAARACASEAKLLDQLVFDQRRQGDVLVVRAERDGVSSGIFFKPTYAHLEVTARLPAGLAYEVDVGSGDAWVSDLKTVRVEVGSGDAELKGIFGSLDAEVGSGDISADGIGQLRVGSVGSGDFEAIRVTGDVRVGDVGSGDLSIRGVGGSVEIASVGSGDAHVEDVSGDLRVLRIGSGDVTPRGVRGRTELPQDD